MPTIEGSLSAGTRATVFAHEILKCQPNAALELLDLANTSATTAYEQFGWKLVGAWSTAIRDDDEAILLWALPDW